MPSNRKRGRPSGGGARPAIAIGYVVLDRQHARVAFLEERQRFCEPLLVAVADHHFHAGVRTGADVGSKSR